MSTRLLSALLLAGMATLVASLPASSQAPAPATEIVIERFSFDPGAITVKSGTKLEFVNRDQIPHAIVAESAGGEIFRSQEQISEGETYSVTLTAPGEIAFYCGLHPGMKGKITVTQ
jgi:plastocyanin